MTSKPTCRYCGDALRPRARGRRSAVCRKGACKRRAARDRQRAYRQRIARPKAFYARQEAS